MLDKFSASIPTKQAYLVALAVILHQKFITIHDVFIDVPKALNRTNAPQRGSWSKRTRQSLRPGISRTE